MPHWENASKPTHISAFDLDHTLINANCSFRFGQFLYQHHGFSVLTMLQLTSFYALHKLGAISIPTLQHKIFNKLFLGFFSNIIKIQTSIFLDQHLEKMLYAPALEKLRTAQQFGHYTLILSSSPNFLVSQIADRLGVHDWASTEYAIDQDQRFCSIAKFMLGVDKANYLTNLAHRLKMERCQITAYSDCIQDLPLLRAAGHPIGVNPDRALRSICRQNNWMIL